MRPLIAQILIIFWLFLPLVEGLHYLFTEHIQCPDCRETLHIFENREKLQFRRAEKRAHFYPQNQHTSHTDVCALTNALNKQEFISTKGHEINESIQTHPQEIRGDIYLYRGEILHFAPKNSPPAEREFIEK